MSALEKLDSWIIDTMFQPIADWLNDWLGVGHNRTGGVFFAFVGILLMCEALVVGGSNPVDLAFDTLFAFGAFLVAAYTIFWGDEHERRQIMTTGAASGYRQYWLWRTLVFAVSSIVGLPIKVLWVLSQSGILQLKGQIQLAEAPCMFIAVYFVACYGKPPKTQRSRIPKGVRASV